MEKEKGKVLAFLDICINDKDPSCLLSSVYCKGIFTGLRTTFSRFTTFSHKTGLIRILVDRTCEINNSLARFENDVITLYYAFKKNQYPQSFINRVVKSYPDKVHNSSNSSPRKDTSIIYFKLQFLNLSNFAKRTVRMLVKKYCKDLPIKLALALINNKN